MSTHRSASTFSRAPNFRFTILSEVLAIAGSAMEVKKWLVVAMADKTSAELFFFLRLRYR